MKKQLNLDLLSQQLTTIANTLSDIINEREESNEQSEQMGQKYYVTYEPLRCYTTIGAENIHHAFNKATKTFKGKYTRIYRNFNARNSDWEFLSVAEFSELLKKV